MNLCVADSSAIGPLLIDDEAEDMIPELPAQLEAGSVIVPGHWFLEVTNMVHNAMRRQRIDQGARDEAYALIASLPVEVDAETNERLWSDTIALMDRHALTIYDACYLELAKRKGAVLATADNALRAAATAEKIGLLGV